MKHIIYIAAALSLLGAASCKTSEENYRAAYEKAIAGRTDSGADPLDGTVYDAARRPLGTRIAVAGTDTALVKVLRVKVTEGGGGPAEWLRPYSVVAGSMKQRFNALSLRQRLAEAGFPRVFVVETAEPRYYVVTESYDTEAEAVAECTRLRADSAFPVPLRAPLPFILRAAGVR